MPGFVRFSLVLSGEIDKVALYKTDDAVGGARNFRENLLVMKVFFNFFKEIRKFNSKFGEVRKLFLSFSCETQKIRIFHIFN